MDILVDILLAIFGGLMSVMLIFLIGAGFREWNIGKDNLRKRYESGLTSFLKALAWGIIIVVIFAIIFY